MKKTQQKPLTQPDDWAVYARMPVDLVSWLDAQAKRERRSRAYVLCQAVRMLQAVRAAAERDARPPEAAAGP